MLFSLAANHRKSNISSYLSRDSSFLPSDQKRYSNHSEKPLLSQSDGHNGVQLYCGNGDIAGDLSVMDCSVIDSEFVSEYCHNNLQVSQEVKRYSSGSEVSYRKSCESVDKNRLSVLSEDSAVKNHSDFLPSEDQCDVSNSENSDDECERQNNLNQPEQKPLLSHSQSEQDLINGITNPNPIGDGMNISREKKNSPSLMEINQNHDSTPNKTNLSMPNLEVKPDGLERPYKEEEFGSHDALLYSLPDLSGIDEQSSGLEQEQTLSQSTNLRPIKIVPRKKVTRLSSDAQVKFDPHRFSLENKDC